MKKALLLTLVTGLLVVGCGKKAPESAVDVAAAQQRSAAASAATEKLAADAGSETSDRADPTLERVAALSEAGQLPSGKWKAGQHYLPVVPAQGTSAQPGDVEVLEVFWFGCGHCYALDPFLENWLKTKPAYIKFVRVPVMWGPVQRAHARLFYTLQTLGQLDSLFGATFDEIQTRNNPLVDADESKTLKMQLAFARSKGIAEADFSREYSGFFVNQALQRADDLTRRYKVEGVPSIVINGKYQTDVSMAGGHEQLIALINDMAAAEKKR